MAKNEVDERPIFEVTQSPGFFDGTQKHEPGSQVIWEVPEGWDEKKLGKHYAHHGPSTTFKPVNKAAEDLLEAHKRKAVETLKSKVSPKTRTEELLEKLIEVMTLQAAGAAAAKDAESKRK